jgi:hypothetical protein
MPVSSAAADGTAELAPGLSAASIVGRILPAALVISERAVEKHVGNIFTKLGLPASEGDHRRVLAVLAYLRT